MAKKELSKVAKTTLLPVVVANEVSRDDILSIGIARFESAAIAEVDRTAKVVANLEQQYKTTKSNAEKAAEARLITEATALVAQAEAAIRALTGGGYKFKHVVGVVINEAGAAINNNYVQMSQSSSGYYNLNLPGKLTSDEEAVVLTLKSLGEQLTTARAAAVDARRRQAQLPTIERQLRGKLAQTRLQTVDGGQELIDAMLSDLTELKALPTV
jgi:hypothetical protein